ncbi:MAG: phosphohydrolase [Bacteroidales bacterium]|nr:phosphohydrolase [Bacteroidales bacterium]
MEWKTKTVAFLHDIAEDTSHTVKDVIKEMKKMLKEIKANPEGVEWFDEYEDMIGIFPNESYHPLTKKEWTEIEEALNVLNQNTVSDRETYIQRFKGNDLAIIVKLNDLRHNMDLTRIPSPKEEDIARFERYKSEYVTLMEFLN